MRVLVLNAGSSTLKCRYDDLNGPPPSDPPAPLWKFAGEWSTGEPPDAILRSVPGEVDVVGHRVVHGGAVHKASVLTDDVRDAIASASAIAPEHNRRELQLIDQARILFGERVRQVAVFDTAFHATIEAPAYVYPGPYAWFEEGIRRFGFHGISHQYASRRAAEILGGDARSLKLVTCHLGNGASLAAVRGGKCVDTTMGFTPLEGLMMGSRSGSIDPGILIHVMRKRGYTADQLDQVLNRESGLLGISGVSEDMREVLAAMDQGNPRAQMAFEIYVHRLVREIGGMIAVLGGLDALVFTGGIGENCAPLRDRVAAQLECLKPRVLVVPAEEEWEIARECWRLTSGC
ncbi:MAG TPA: acetate/propionate family kinase [Bryobacteraceae bacterium]|nr:acetate/propionate family kinase [Bryobacteraceae bacterium]